MNDASEGDNHLERRMHRLLCGELGEAERLELLERVAADEPARQLLAEMVAVRRAAARAAGLDDAAGDIPAALDRLRGRLSARPGRAGVGGTGESSGHGPGRSGAGAGPRPALRARVRRGALALGALAAAGVVAASLYLAATAHETSRRGADELAAARRQLAALQARHDALAARWYGEMSGRRTARIAFAAPELARYRRLWRAAVLTASDATPWVLPRGHEMAEIGYLRPDGAAAAVALRCSVLAADGTVLEQINVLLPRGTGAEVDLGPAGMLAGRPVRCRVAARGDVVDVALQVGDGDPPGLAGLQGRVWAGAGPAEIGRFRLRDRPYRVVLQAVGLDAG